jgi:hypothetical protein
MSRLFYTVFAGVLLFLGSCKNNSNKSGNGADSTVNAQQQSVQAYVKLAIMYRADSLKLIDSIPVKGDKISVKDAMEVAVQQKKLAYETKAGQHGMIEGIDGWRNDGAKKYWWLCVNDTCAAAGFEDQKALPGSTIAWHYVTDGKQPCKNCSYNN